MDIIIFALIAGFVAYQLHAVLGRRHGEERQRPPLVGGDTPAGAKGEAPAKAPGDNVVVFTGRNRNPTATTETAEAEADQPASVDAGLKRIRSADANFDERSFLGGARAAFQMINEAYAAGDTDTLRSLLDDAVYEGLAAAIQKRKAAGETLERTVMRIREADITRARLTGGRMAVITVAFVSDQINVTRNAAGTVIDGQAGAVEEAEDVWTFTRDTSTADPNWRLVATEAPPVH